MIESLIRLHRAVYCIKVIRFSFQSGSCLDSKCLINLPVFFLWLKIFFFNRRHLLAKGGKKDIRRGFFLVLLLRVDQGRNCFIMLSRIICLLESLDKYYAWTMGRCICPLWGQGQCQRCQGSASCCDTGERVWWQEGFESLRCPKVPGVWANLKDGEATTEKLL